jgi:aspartyl-tRNA(Asn)/glutamyl-tRNA(Gln) amidotransferase subunit C
MPISKEDIARVARLARIGIKENQETQIRAQLNKVLEYMEILQRVDTKDVEPTYHTAHVQNAFREDEVRSSLSQDASLRNAPAKKDDFFTVPKVL